MRRRVLLWSPWLALAATTSIVHAARPRALPLRLGADVDLVDSGLAGALRRAFGRDIGIGVNLVRAPVTATLAALAAGELDVALSNAPALETGLEAQGLVHDRRHIATGEFLVVGPARGPRRHDAPASGGIGPVLRSLAAAALRPDALFLSSADGSGAHLAEQAAWRLAGIAPGPPWYQTAPAGRSLAEQARDRAAHAFVERGTWQARGGEPLAVVAAGDPALLAPVHAMRAFRSPHPAAKLFMGWIAGDRGRAVVRRVPGYRPSGPGAANGRAA